MLVGLLCQYGIGIGVNLFVPIPSGPKTNGAGPGFARAIAHGAPPLIAHVLLAFCLIAGAIVTLILATSRGGIVLAAAIIGLAALLAATFTGATFVASGGDAASLAMALFWAVAMLSYIVTLFVRQPRF